MKKSTHKHIESTVKVYFSNKYGIFKFMKGNRDINELKVKSIIKTIKDDGIDVLKCSPVIVDQYMNILDGQHRFAVSMQLKLPVFYIISEDVDLLGVTKINSNSSNWKTRDYLNSYCDLNKPAYLKIREITKNYKVTPMVVANLLDDSTLSDTGNISQKFKDGLIVLHHYNETVDTLNTCLEYKDYIDNPLTRSFITAIIRLKNNEVFSKDLMIRKLKMSGRMIKNTKSTKSIIQEMEEIINHQQKHRIILYT